MTVTSSSTQLDYRQVFVYINGELTWYSDWEPLSAYQPKRGV